MAASQEFFIISPLLIILIIFAAVSHLCHPLIWPFEPTIGRKLTFFSQLIKVVGRSFSINLISFDWNLPDSEISWLQLYIQVKLSSKTAVSRLLAYPSVSYFWSTCHPQHLLSAVNWCGNCESQQSCPREKCCFGGPSGAPAVIRGRVHWSATALCKDTSAQGQFGSKVNDQLWLSVSQLKCTIAFFCTVLGSLPWRKGRRLLIRVYVVIH